MIIEAEKLAQLLKAMDCSPLTFVTPFYSTYNVYASNSNPLQCVGGLKKINEKCFTLTQKIFLFKKKCSIKSRKIKRIHTKQKEKIRYETYDLGMY